MADDRVADALAGVIVPFEADGRTYHIDQPLTAEYDDAIAIENATRRYWLAQPELATLAALPCSDEERALYDGLIADARERLADMEAGSARHRATVAEIERLERSLADRTLADETAGRRAILERDRYLCKRLLCDGDGQRMMDWRKPTEAGRIWEETIPLTVKDAARPHIWAVLGWVRSAPFGLVRPREQPSL